MQRTSRYANRPNNIQIFETFSGTSCWNGLLSNSHTRLMLFLPSSLLRLRFLAEPPFDRTLLAVRFDVIVRLVGVDWCEVYVTRGWMDRLISSLSGSLLSRSDPEN